MPTYDYECGACDHRFERWQEMSARKLRTCPECGKRKLVRLVGAGAGVIFRGSGFYETDYKRKQPSSTAAGSSSSPDAKGNGGSSSSDGQGSDASSSSPSPASAPASKPGSKPESESKSGSESGSGSGSGSGRSGRSGPRAS